MNETRTWSSIRDLPLLLIPSPSGPDTVVLGAVKGRKKGKRPGFYSFPSPSGTKKLPSVTITQKRRAGDNFYYILRSFPLLLSFYPFCSLLCSRVSWWLLLLFPSFSHSYCSCGGKRKEREDRRGEKEENFFCRLSAFSSSLLSLPTCARERNGKTERRAKVSPPRSLPLSLFIYSSFSLTSLSGTSLVFPAF